MKRLVFAIFIIVSFYSVKGHAVSEPAIVNNYGTLLSSEIDPSNFTFLSHSYEREMKIRQVANVIYFSFSDGSYRKINLDTASVKDVSRLLHSGRDLEDGERDPGRRITNYYQLTDVNKPTWHLYSENKAVYDDYLLFAKSVESEALIDNLSKPKDINSTLLQSTIQGLSGSAGSLPSCTHEKALLDYGYNGHATWDDCSGMARAGFIVASFSVLECFIPVWNLIGCPAAAAALLYGTANMFSTGEHCTATYERAQTNLNLCIQENEAETDLGKTGGDDESSGERESGGLRCNRWESVQISWQGLYGDDAGSWDSYDMCVEWVNF